MALERPRERGILLEPDHSGSHYRVRMKQKADKQKTAASKNKFLPGSVTPLDPPQANPDLSSLRRRAEELVATVEVPPEDLSPDEAARLIHELRVHQIELEMQNDELRLSQASLEESRSRYADLYDFAPVGYLTLDERGAIVEANLTASFLLGRERSRLLGLYFSYFLTDDDRGVLRQLLTDGQDPGEQRGEVHIKDGDGSTRVMLLDALSLRDAEGRERHRITMTDITGRKQAEEALRESEERLSALAGQLLTAQEDERKRLAAELHDELGHSLLILKMRLSSMEKKLQPDQEELRNELRAQLEFVQEEIQEVRRLYNDLSPGDIEDLGLTRALNNLITEFAGRTPDLAWEVDLMELKGLFSLPVQTFIYRICQEALTNIGKHAHPTRVTVSTTLKPDQVEFSFKDDGRGFDLQERHSGDPDRGMGLAAMEERLRMVGGTLTIKSRKQGGTRLSFTIPFSPKPIHR